MSVYFDTSAWNAVRDWSIGKSFKWFEGQEYLFSSCNLDEFALAHTSRSRQLAEYAWRVSNRRKLLDHIELTVAEISAFQRSEIVSVYDVRDRAFLPA